MQSHFSLTNLIAAVLLFAVAVVMHEAARADNNLLSQGITPVAERLVTKPGKKPLGFKGFGDAYRAQDRCRAQGSGGAARLCPGND